MTWCEYSGSTAYIGDGGPPPSAETEQVASAVTWRDGDALHLYYDAQRHYVFEGGAIALLHDALVERQERWIGDVYVHVDGSVDFAATEPPWENRTFDTYTTTRSAWANYIGDML